MSTDAGDDGRVHPCRALGEYIGELVRRLDEGEPSGGARLRAVAGPLRARIQVDGETVEIGFSRGALRIDPGPTRRRVDGIGRCDRQTVLDLLNGYMEVTDAILGGYLEVTGNVDAVTRMGQAIEVLLDAATRVPALHQLADDYRSDPCLAPGRPGPRAPALLPTLEPAEHALFARLDLLP